MADSAGQNSGSLDIIPSVVPETSSGTEIERKNPNNSQVASRKSPRGPTAASSSKVQSSQAAFGSATASSSKSKVPVSSANQPTRNTKQQRAVINRVIVATAQGDFYAVLNVPEKATQDAIQKAYKQTAKAIHPDKSGDTDADDNMKMVMKARDILMDLSERRKYPKPKKHPKSTTYGEDFADTAWEDEPEERENKFPPDIVQIRDEARGTMILLSIPEKELREFYRQANALEANPENRQWLQANKDEAIEPIKHGGLPDSWASMLPPDADQPMGEDTNGDQGGEHEETHEESDNEQSDNEQSDNGQSDDGQSDDGQYVYTDDREPILGFSNVRTEIGHHITARYLAHEGKLQPGKEDVLYSKEDAKRYKRIIGVASKPIQTKTSGASRLPTAWVYACFIGANNKTSTTRVWITRTTLRKVCGKASADQQIRKWYLQRKLTLVDDIPPLTIKRKFEAKKIGSVDSSEEKMNDLNAKMDRLTDIVFSLTGRPEARSGRTTDSIQGAI